MKDSARVRLYETIETSGDGAGQPRTPARTLSTIPATGPPHPHAAAASRRSHHSAARPKESVMPAPPGEPTSVQPG
jgi:hypothetical protein